MNKLLVRWTLETMLDVHRTGSFYLLSVLYRQCLLQGMRIVWGHDDRAIAIVDRFHADEAAPFALIQIADGVSGLFSRIPHHRSAPAPCLETTTVRFSTGSRSSSV